jgi:multiple sugar transport system permease protein
VLKNKKERFFIIMMLAPMMAVLISFYLYPTFYNLYNSFTDSSLLGLKKGGAYIGFDNYIRLFQDKAFGRLLWNTFFWLTFVSVSLRLVLGVLLALLLNSETLKKFKLTGITRLSLLVPWATPAVVAVIAWRFMLDPREGIVNQILLSTGMVDQPIAFLSKIYTVWPVVIIIIIWNSLPLVTMSYLASLQTIPETLYEAAEIDGANDLQKFFHITLPQLMPTTLVLSLLLVVWTFNNFVYVWLTTAAGPGSYTNVLATEIFIRGFIDFELGYSSAIGMMMAAMMALFGMFYYHYLAKKEFSEII